MHVIAGMFPYHVVAVLKQKSSGILKGLISRSNIIVLITDPSHTFLLLLLLFGDSEGSHSKITIKVYLP